MNMEIVIHHFPTILGDVHTVFWILKFFRSEIIQEPNNISEKFELFLKIRILSIQTSKFKNLNLI